ncbi:MAG TPA: hypothetical protein VFF73_13350 [Planctomycetota bacterium]|nr:hypothetical protein [Planctomycetota bacterium]
MKLRAGIAALGLALAIPAFAQDKDPLTPQGTKKVVCGFCGAARESGDTCPYCGSRETSTDTPTKDSAPKTNQDAPKTNPPAQTPTQTPSTTKPAGDEFPKPAQDQKTLTPKVEEKPVVDEEGADAKARAYKDDNMAKGDYYFKTGYYLKASEAYRVAVLAEPTNAWKKLSFGHALFAIGNYSYSSYALRRAVSQLDSKTPFSQDVSSLFPSKRAFEKAVKDLKRYVTYSPRDPAGLSVLGYMLFSQGEDDHAKEMFQYLQKLPKNENDAFAAFFLKQIDARKGGPALSEPKPEQKPVASAPEQPKPDASKLTAPEGARQGEEGAKPKPAPSRALAE